MKLTPRGFTLVELMIVIAIIGILAAALFPSLTSYLARGRDTSRAAGIKEISTAVAAYTIDQGGTVPNGTGTTNDCAPKQTLSQGSTKYISSKWPADPVSTRSHCSSAGEFGYGTGTTNGTQAVAFSATFESPSGGNTSTGITTYQGTALKTGESTLFPQIDSMTKGSGSGYVIRN